MYITEKAVVTILCKWLGIVHFALGSAIIWGGPDRFAGISYQPLLEVANGEVWHYGLVFIISGIAMLAPKITLNIIGLAVGVVINNIWAALFLVAILQSPDSGVTGTVAYGGYALTDAILCGLLWSRRKGPTAGSA